MTNRVYAVSLGPGPADLMTVRARNVIGQSDNVFVQARDVKWLAGISGAFLPAEKIRAYMPKPNKWGFARHDPVYEAIAGEMAGLVKTGKRVSVVALGDAGFYSYFGYFEAPLARRGIEWEYVPGIPFVAAAALVTGHAFIDANDTLVVKHIAQVSDLDAIFAVASVAVLYGVPREHLSPIREYVLQHGIAYARTVWLGLGSEPGFAADLLTDESSWHAGCSVILRRSHPGQ